MAKYLATAGLTFLLAAGSGLNAQVIFNESFDDPSSSSNFVVTTVGATVEEDLGDAYSEFGFDYSATGGSRLSADITTAVTGSPAGGGSESGIILAANFDGNRTSVNVYPKLAPMSGITETDADTGLEVIQAGLSYTMTFDFFGAVNGTGPLQTDGSGTSEFFQFGAGSDGDGKHMNGFSANEGSPVAPDSDFLELNVSGDFGNSDGIPFTDLGSGPTLAPQGFVPSHEAALQSAFPAPATAGDIDTPGTHLGEDRYTNLSNGTLDLNGGADGIPDGGAPVERWATGEIFVDAFNAETTFRLNGVDIVTLPLSIYAADISAGLPWFGYVDFYGSIAGGDSQLVKEAGGGGSATGDYNTDGVVDSIDYAVWRESLGDSVTPGDGADGNGNGVIDQGDFDEWLANFGATGGGSGSSFDPFNASYVIVDNVVIEVLPAASLSNAPEPTCAALFACLICAMGLRRQTT